MLCPQPQIHVHIRSVLAAALLATACSTDGPNAMLEGSGSENETGDETGDESEGETAPTWRSLVDNGAWQPDLAENDPAADHRPQTVVCDLGWYVENGGIEIDTGECNYLSLRQPLLETLEPGDPLSLQVWWQTLASVEPAEGHLALFVDDERLWEELVPIPGPAEARTIEFQSPLAAPAGATLTLHLHNHGYNTWHFHELNVFSARP